MSLRVSNNTQLQAPALEQLPRRQCRFWPAYDQGIAVIEDQDESELWVADKGETTGSVAQSMAFPRGITFILIRSAPSSRAM